MADTKTTALAALATVAAEDLLLVIDDPSGTPVSKKATAAVLGTYVHNVHGVYNTNTTFAGGAGNNTTTSVESCGFGWQALKDLTTGGANTAFGNAALIENTSGTENSGFGTHAGKKITTGSFNTAIGCDAIYTCVSGNYNTVVGAHAMFYGTGSGITAVGAHCFRECTTGIENVGLGHLSGAAVTTGGSNVAIGTKTLSQATAANYNTCLGHSALLSATGNGNTAVGYLSGYTMTSGSNNVLIGTSNFVAASYGQVTTGSRNVSIGVETAVASATASNQLCISNFIYGTGMSGSGATISTGGKLGFGTKAPDYFVHVNGAFGIAPGASVTPANNGDVVFELTNNTTLTIKAKGSDGTVRSGTVALA